MATVSRNRTGRRLLLKEQGARELRRELFRLFGQDPEYRGVITDDLRDYWQAVALPADHPERFNFRVLRETAREAADPALNRYVDAVEDFVSGELLLKVDETPVEWAGNYVHSHTVPPEYLVEYIRTNFPEEEWDATQDDMVFAMGIDRWDSYQLPDPVVIDSSQITIHVSPMGAIVHVQGQAPTRFICRTNEWLSFNDLPAVKKAARAALKSELDRLSATFEQRYGKPDRNRPALARDVRTLLPQLVRYIRDPHYPPPSEAHFTRLDRLAERIGFKLVRL